MEAYNLDYKQRPTTIVQFMLRGDDLDPKIITEALGATPSKSWKKGDTYQGKGKIRFKPYPTGSWCLVPASSKFDDFETQLGLLLDQLESLPPVLHSFIKMYDGAIIVGHSSGERNLGFVIDHPLMERLCKLQLAISFDIYLIVEDDQEI